MLLMLCCVGGNVFLGCTKKQETKQEGTEQTQPAQEAAPAPAENPEQAQQPQHAE